MEKAPALAFRCPLTLGDTSSHRCSCDRFASRSNNLRLQDVVYKVRLVFPPSPIVVCAMDKIQKLAIGSIFVGTVVLGAEICRLPHHGQHRALFGRAGEHHQHRDGNRGPDGCSPQRQPADKNHPYGHHKVEYFSAVLEGVLIIVAALAILREAYAGFLGPKAIDAPLGPCHQRPGRRRSTPRGPGF